MKQVSIVNPILNSPFEEPTRHFRFADDGITDEVVQERRLSTYLVPVPQAKKRGRQLSLDTGTAPERIKTCEFIDRVRERVKLWRQQRWPGVTRTTARLLEHWTSPEREGRRLFFCQVEAVETAIYLAEVAEKRGDSWIATELRQANEGANPGLNRLAFKMATGSGKTVVMAMLIAWQSLRPSRRSGSGRSLLE
jgi:type III restriction enzyme